MDIESQIESSGGANTESASGQPAGNSGNVFSAATIAQHAPVSPQKPKKTSGWRIFLNVLLGLSIITNAILFLILLGIGVAAVTAEKFAGKTEFLENTLVDGPHTKKIAVVNLYGIIQDGVSEEVRLQLKAAAEDDSVKGVILRIASPGGTVSSSDQIHYYVGNLRQQTGKPVVAFMQTIAASGGYYSAVACDRIVAEPTVITGSIGVIMNHLVIKDLLELKLGIQPEVLKSGPKKDWPSMYAPMTEEQKQYLNEKLITPAYERFVNLVSEGRKHVLTPERVRLLADGSIYPADEALENGLIDEIGYFETAVAAAEKLADISDARVVEYQRPLSWLSAMGAKSPIPVVDSKMLEKLLVPQLMYLWDGTK
jgi:protease-4